MNKYFKSIALGTLIVVTLLAIAPSNVSQAKSSKSILSFSIFNGVTNDEFNNMNDKEKVILLRSELKKKNILLGSLERTIRKSKKYEKVEDLLSKFALKIVKDNIKSQVDNYMDKGNNIDTAFTVDEMMPVDSEVKSKEEGAKMSFESLGDYVSGKVSSFVFDKTNITDANVFYKVSHKRDVFDVLNQSLYYKNNIELLAKRWTKENMDVPYLELMSDEDKYQADENIKKYLICINISTALCENMEGQSILENNIIEYVSTKRDEKIKEKFDNELEEAMKKLPNRIGKLWVTSYNPRCEQTKGGVMGEDGACYGTESMPCAIGSNKGKTSGLCGNPYISATGHNMKDMINEGKRPIAVTQELGFLKGKEVFLKCYSKRTGEEVYDGRCNGYFTVYDTKHKRFTNSVDLFFENKSDNIGGVDVEIYYK